MSQEFLSTTSFKNITDLLACAARIFSDILYKEFECPTFSASCAQGNLGVVYYNFPHAGAVSGFFDGQLLSAQDAVVYAANLLDNRGEDTILSCQTCYTYHPLLTWWISPNSHKYTRFFIRRGII